MGIQVTIDGVNYEVQSYLVNEASTPIASNDSSGSIGTIDDVVVNAALEPLLLKGRSITLKDTRRGTITGTVYSAVDSGNGTTTLSCHSRLGRLNIYNAQATPFFGTLGQAFRHYVGMAGYDLDTEVHPSLESRPVNFPGWYGELWFHLKQMAAAEQCEVALVDGVIHLRPLRSRIATDRYNVARSRTAGETPLAKAVEVYCYNTQRITNKIVYPPGGWSNDVQVITLNAGETIEQTLELSASVSSIQQPTMATFVSPDYQAASVFTAIGDDEIPIQAAQWAAYGGQLAVTINLDTTSLTLKITAPLGIANKDGKPIGSYAIALSAGTSTSRYSTLRIVGSGVSFDKEKIRYHTGIGDEQSATEVGATIDNIFISTRQQAHTAGSLAAKQYSGIKIELSGEVTNIEDQATSTGLSMFGNVSGSRVWDERTKRWYRIRSDSVGASGASFSADDDITHGDLLEMTGTMTYTQFMAKYGGMTYMDFHLKGLR